MKSYNAPEGPTDFHFDSKANAEQFKQAVGGRLRNNSHRRYGQSQVKKTPTVYAVRVRPRNFAHKIDLAEKAKECGRISDPWKA